MSLRLPYVIPGVILILLGFLWALQGAGVVGGSAMTGNPIWIWIGLAVVLVGLGLGYLGTRRRASS